MAARWRSGSGPQATMPATMSSVTCLTACSKWRGRGACVVDPPAPGAYVDQSRVALQAALPEQPHDGDRLLQHLPPDGSRRPAVAKDVLVEILSGSDSEEEAAIEE